MGLGVESGMLEVINVGRVGYAEGLALQREHHAAVLAARETDAGGVGRVLLVEHDPVITVSRRPGARDHLVAGEAALSRAGVEVCETDRGGDITYHGPGQLVVYPIVDLNRMGIGLHGYMRMLEGVVMEVCRGFGVEAGREEGVTGVWVEGDDGVSRKVCAMGIRVRRWVTMHGLALNVTTNLEHFGLIVGCGLAGREATSLARELGAARCPGMGDVKGAMGAALARAVGAVMEGRGEAAGGGGG